MYWQTQRDLKERKKPTQNPQYSKTVLKHEGDIKDFSEIKAERVVTIRPCLQKILKGVLKGEIKESNPKANE